MEIRTAFTATLLCATFSVSLGWGQRESGEALSTEIEVLNRALLETANQAAQFGRLNGMLGRRAAMLKQLLALDPARAYTLALPEDLAARLRATSAYSDAIETLGQWEGVTESLVWDDFASNRSVTRWYLRTPDARLELFFSGQPPAKGGVAIRIHGVRIANRVGALDSTEIQAAPAALAYTQFAFRTSP